MNELPGKINQIQASGNLCVLSILINTQEIQAIFLENPTHNKQIKVGSDVQVLFKETEVIIAQAEDLKISLSNQLRCIVSTIQIGELLTRVQLTLEEHTINSLIISSHIENLNLQIGDQVFALIKSNEIMIAPK